MSVGRKQRRAGLAAERLAGWRRKACPGCMRLVLMNEALKATKHEDPPCEWFVGIVQKAATIAKAKGETMGEFESQEFTCPNCGGHHFGTHGLFPGAEGMCHDEHGVGCRFTWPRTDDAKYFKGTGHFMPRTVQGRAVT